MKKVITLTLLFIILCSCGNKQNKVTNDNDSESVVERTPTILSETEHLIPKNMNITDAEWQKMIENYKSIEEREKKESESETSEGYIELTEEDLAYGKSLAYKILQTRSWKSLSDPVYVSRIKYVFGIDLDSKNATVGNRLIKRKDYTVYIMPQFLDIKRNDESKFQYSTNKVDYYFYRKEAILFPNKQSVDWYMRHNEEDGYFLVNGYSEIYFHLNNYILHGNKASLTWLINQDVYYFHDLFYLFGYDKEDALNVKFLTDAKSDDFYRLFASRDIYGNLDVREGLLETVSKHSSKEFNDYYSLLQDYAYSISDYKNDSDSEQKKLHTLFTQAERRKILAHVFNTMQPIYTKYNQQCLNGEYGVLDKYDIGIEDSFWNICFNDRHLIKDFEAHNCYGLPFLKSFLEKLRADGRFVNRENEELEPWIYNPWDVPTGE